MFIDKGNYVGAALEVSRGNMNITPLQRRKGGWASDDLGILDISSSWIPHLPVQFLMVDFNG